MGVVLPGGGGDLVDDLGPDDVVEPLRRSPPIVTKNVALTGWPLGLTWFFKTC